MLEKIPFPTPRLGRYGSAVPASHNSSGPVNSPHNSPLHTDACLLDVRRFGFCEHQVLAPEVPSYPALPPPNSHTPRARLSPRELTSSAALGLNVTCTILIMHLISPLPGLVLSGLIGLSWLLILTLGLPRWFTWLLDPPPLPRTPPRRSPRHRPHDHPQR